MSDPAKLHSSIVGGSSAGRVLACSGSIRLSAEAIGKSSIYAEEGTSLHMAMEAILSEDTLPERVMGRKFGRFTMVEDEHLQPLQDAVAAFERIVGTKEFELERRDPLPEIPGAFGTTDVTYFNRGGVFEGIIDWKFGEGHKVMAGENGQMMFYLRSQYARFEPFLVDDTCKATIVQPRLQHEDTAIYTPEELVGFATELAAAISGPEEFHRGEWCHWCAGKRRCPEWHGKQVKALDRFLRLVQK